MDDLGEAGLVEERKVSDEKMTFVEHCDNPKSVSIILRGGTEHAVDELDQVMEDHCVGWAFPWRTSCRSLEAAHQRWRWH